jgi:hypothetical protein
MRLLAALAAVTALLIQAASSSRRGRALAPAWRKVPSPPRIAAHRPGACRWKSTRRLCPGARLPAYDGDPVFVSLPGAASRTERQAMFRPVIAPILKALRFEQGPGAFAPPPEAGVKQPVGDWKRLAPRLVEVYARHPTLYRPMTRRMLDAFLGKDRPDAEIDRALAAGDGMTFAQYVAGIERQEIVSPAGPRGRRDRACRPRRVSMGGPGRQQRLRDRVQPLHGGEQAAARRRGRGRGGHRFAPRRHWHRVRAARASARWSPRGPLAVRDRRLGAGSAPPRVPAAPARPVRRASREPSCGWTRERDHPQDGAVRRSVMAIGRTFSRDPGRGTTMETFEVDTAAARQYRLQRSRSRAASTTRGRLQCLQRQCPGGAPGACRRPTSTRRRSTTQRRRWRDGSQQGFQQVNLFAT